MLVPIWGLVMFAFIFGSIVGSFLATISIRWPRGESILTARSKCDSCGGVLRAQDLVPILSFLLLGRHCRRCASPIDPRHLAIEIMSGAIGVASIVLFPNWLGLIVAGVGWLMLLIAILDLYHFWLPDSLTLALLLVALGLTLIGLDPNILDRIIGAGAGFLILSLMAGIYRAVTGREGLGAGDPKLLAAIGACFGWKQLPWILLGAGLLGLAIAFSLRLAGRKMSATTPVPLGSLLVGVAWPLWLIDLALTTTSNPSFEG